MQVTNSPGQPWEFSGTLAGARRLPAPRVISGDEPVAIYPAGGFFLGFLVPAGSHETRLFYDEPGLWAGSALALLTVVLLLLLLRRATSAARAVT